MKKVKFENWSFELYHPAKGRTSRQVGIVLVHEIFGLGNHIRLAAEKLSEQGYIVAAVDLFRGKFEPDLRKALKLSRSVSDREKIGMMESGLELLRKEIGQTAIVGVMGFSFGGGVALLACSNIDFDFCIVYYGSIAKTEQLKNMKGPILLIEGTKTARDAKWVEERFLPAVLDYGKRVEIQLYPGATHGFHNSENKHAHNPEAAQDAWEKTLRFLSQF